MSEFFERILSKQINNFMKTKLSAKQCGFRKNHSSQHSLMFILENGNPHYIKGNM